MAAFRESDFAGTGIGGEPSTQACRDSWVSALLGETADNVTYDELQTVPSVGPSIAQDLRDLGVTSIAAPARRNPERLYRALNEQTGVTQDPCVLYSFRCAVYFAGTAKPRPELLKWWNWKGRTLDRSGFQQ